MPDLPDDLRALLHDRALDAPAAPAPTRALVRRVRRRRAARATALLAAPVLAVGGVVAVAAGVTSPSRDAVRPVAPSPVPSLIGDKYEFCSGPPRPSLDVSVHATEWTFADGCHVVAEGFTRITFRNPQATWHNVAVTVEGGVERLLQPLAKTAIAEDEVVTLTWPGEPLAAGDYDMYCEVHPLMRSQLVVR